MLAFAPEGGEREDHRTYSQRIAEARDDAEICCGFLEHVRGRKASQAEQALIRRTVDTALSSAHER